MVFSATFNNISAILWRSVGGGNRRKPRTCRKSLTNYIAYYCIKYTSPWTRFELTNLVVIGTDYTGSCKSNYHAIWPRQPLQDQQRLPMLQIEDEWPWSDRYYGYILLNWRCRKVKLIVSFDLYDILHWLILYVHALCRTLLSHLTCFSSAYCYYLAMLK